MKKLTYEMSYPVTSNSPDHHEGARSHNLEAIKTKKFIDIVSCLSWLWPLAIPESKQSNQSSMIYWLTELMYLYVD